MSEKQKTKKPFYKRLWFIGIVLVVVFIAVAGSSDEEPTKSDVAKVSDTSNESASTEPKKESVDLSISGPELAKAFDENEIRAKNDYTGKKAEITGRVADIGEVFGQTYITLESFEDFAITSVQCIFDKKEEIEKIANLNKGDKVTIIGTIGEKSMNVEVKKCRFK